MRSVRRVCYAGTYERDYPRNRLVILALRDAGVRVEEAHVPVFERLRDKGDVSWQVLAGLLVRLMVAYLRLIPDVALRLLRCDTLMIGYIGQLDVLVLAPVAKLLGRRVVFNPLVSLTDTLVEDRGRFRNGSVRARAAWLVDRTAMQFADLVLTDTEENADYFARSFGIDRSMFQVVQVGAQEDLFFPCGSVNDGAARLDVLFVGKFIPLHGVKTILRAAALLQDRRVPARIEMVGGGQEYAASRRLALDLELENVVWADWIPFEELGERLRKAHIALGIFDGGPKAARVIPNKVHQALACGTAVVTRESPAMSRMLVNGESALLVPPADPEALADAVETLLEPDRRRGIGEAGLESWKNWGARESLAAQVARALEGLAERP